MTKTAHADDYVQLHEVTLRIPGEQVFQGTTWRLPRDEVWAIRGASGAGKTLFAAAIMGKLPRACGLLRHPFLAGRRGCEDTSFGVLPPGTIAIASMDHHRRLTARRAFHQLRWHGSLAASSPTVRDYLSQQEVESRSAYAILDSAEIARFEQARDREVQRFSLAPLLEKPLHALSNGELHRLLLARALMCDPGLLIVDEPFAGLDVSTRARVAELLESLPRQGTGVLYVVARDADLPTCVSHELEVRDRQVSYMGPRRFSAAEATPANEPQAGRPRSTNSSEEPSAPGAPRDTVLELRDASVHQVGTTILQNVSWTIRSGEQWALLGPNGSGKSTLLSLMMGDNPQAHRNHVVVAGRRLAPGTSIWELKRRVGWVSPELDAHYPGAVPAIEAALSGFFGTLGLHASASVDACLHARAWLARIGYGQDPETPLQRLGPLERRLVLLARACVNEPVLLLLDEPCQGLDEAARRAFLAALDRAIERLGAAMIYVSHEQAELPPRIDRALELAEGRVVRQGSLA